MTAVDGFEDRAADDEAGFSRRRVLTVGGFSVALTAVIAACASDPPKAQVPQAGTAPSTTGVPDQNITDEVLLRTASSLEHTLIAAYHQVQETNALTGEAASNMQLFIDHHTVHASYFENLTADIGGTPFTGTNAAMEANIVTPSLKSISDAGNQPADFIWFMYGLENVAAGTFQLFVPDLSVPRLRGQLMAVGGVEARHAAIATKQIPTATVVPLTPDEAAAAATTTTTIKGGTTTTTPPNQAVQVAQVPGAFGSLTAVNVAVAGKEQTFDLLGPNSYEYTS